MNDNELVKSLIHDIRDNIGRLVGTEGKNIYIVRGTIELAIESAFRNFFNTTSKVLLIGRKESIEYIEYICETCGLKYDSVYMENDLLPLENIRNQLNSHYDAIYIPYAEMNSGVVYNVNLLKKNINMEHILLIVNIGSNILMNPTMLDNELIDVVIGGLEMVDSLYSFVGVNNKVKGVLNNTDYFINYSSYDTYLSTNNRWLTEYQRLNDTLITINQIDITEWYSYFAYLVAFIRTKIKSMGYRVIPATNYSNAFIVIDVTNSEQICEELYKKYDVLVYAGYNDNHNTRIIIDMKNYSDISTCLKLLRALKELSLK